RHKDDTWDLVLRRHDTLPHATNLYYGVEGLADYVNSNNLGVHSRKRGAVYGDLDVRSWQRFSLSAGLRQEFYGRARTISVPAGSMAMLESQVTRFR
ncbi:MAG: TonB-dependent receptor, partial [Bryobacteraceae bacterium]